MGIIWRVQKLVWHLDEYKYTASCHTPLKGAAPSHTSYCIIGFHKITTKEPKWQVNKHKSSGGVTECPYWGWSTRSGPHCRQLVHWLARDWILCYRQQLPTIAWLETDRNRSESRSAHSVLPWAVITIFDDLIHSLLPRSQRRLWSPTESKTFAVSHSFPLSGFQLTQGDLTTFQLWLNYWQA